MAHRKYTPTSLDMFWARCEARARLYSIGEMDLHEAVDGLQEHAERHGVIAELGQDAAQSILSEAFRRATAKRRFSVA